MSLMSRHGPFTYQTVNGVDYKVDLVLPKSLVTRPAPLVVFFHGGGICFGSRGENEWFPHWLQLAAVKAGFGFASADYTLLSPGTGWDIVNDVKQLFIWIGSDLENELKLEGGVVSPIDVSQVFVVGQSGGGIPAAYASLYSDPKPRAMINFFAMGGDFTNDLYVVNKKEPFFKFLTPDFLPLFTSMDRWSSLRNAPLDSPPTIEVNIDEPDNPRIDYGVSMMQEGIWVDTLTGKKGIGKQLAAYPWEGRSRAIHQDIAPLIPSVAADASFPPTFLVHGELDTCIPAAESRNMAKVLKQRGVEVVYLELEGEDHGFDFKPSNFDTSALEEQIIAFMLKHVTA